MKTCSKCNIEQPVDNFHRNKGNADGRHGWCHACHLIYNREWRKRNPEKAKAHRQRSAQKYGYTYMNQRHKTNHPEKYLAQRAVKNKVRYFSWPPAWTMVCDVCQESLASHYHHHLGYAEENRLNVIPVCRECHGKEHARWDRN